MNEELHVGFNPVPAAERVARWDAIVRSRLITLAIVAAGAVALWFFKRSWLQQFWYLALLVVVAAVVWIIGALVLGGMARKDLAGLDDGAAMVISRTGVQVRGTDIPWADVTAIRTRAGMPGRSPGLLVQRTTGGSFALPLDYLDRSGGELDNAVRAYSNGRFGVDLSGTGV